MFDFFAKVWGWLNGKKTVIGALITVLSAIVAFVGVALPAFGVDAVLVAQVTGFIVSVIGLLHKLAKALGAE